MSKHKSKEELLAELLNKGYGEDERARWLEKKQKSERIKRDTGGKKKKTSGKPPVRKEPISRRVLPTGQQTQESQKRIADRLKPLSPRLRRRIDAYAYHHKYSIISAMAWIRSLLTVFFPKLKDYTNKSFVRSLVNGRGYLNESPYGYCLLDNMDALYFASRSLLGISKKKDEQNEGKTVLKLLMQRIPLAVRIFGVLGERNAMFDRSLNYLKVRLSAGRKIEVMELSRATYSLYRLCHIFENVTPERINSLCDAVSDVHKGLDPDKSHYSQIDTTVGRFQIAYANLWDFKREFFPGLLKFIGIFFVEEQSDEPEYRRMILDFLDLSEKDILPFEEYKRRKQEKETKPTVETSDETDAETEENEEEEKKRKRDREIKNVLNFLGELFPQSNLEKLTEWPHLLSYFDVRVFNKNLKFPGEIQNVSRLDPAGQIMILHRILDNLLTSLDPRNLDEVFSANGKLEVRLSDIIKEWQTIYSHVFDPYLNELNDYYRLIVTSEEQGVSMSTFSRKLEDNLNQIKNQCIRNFGRIVGEGSTPFSSVRLYKLAEELSGVLAETRDTLNLEKLGKKDKISVRVLQELVSRKVVDFEVNAYKPVMGRLRECIEEKYKAPITRVPYKGQFIFFDTLFRFADLYAHLLNDEDSLYRGGEGGTPVADERERNYWKKTEDSVKDILSKQPNRKKVYETDPLTGIIDLEHWEKEFVSQFEEFHSTGKPLTFLSLYIDGLEGYEKSDSVFHKILTGFSEVVLGDTGDKVYVGEKAVRLGTHEILLIRPDGVEDAKGYCEKVRAQLGQRLENLRDEIQKSLTEKGMERKNVGTLSIGIARVEDCDDLTAALQRLKVPSQKAQESTNKTIIA